MCEAAAVVFWVASDLEDVDPALSDAGSAGGEPLLFTGLDAGGEVECVAEAGAESVAESVPLATSAALEDMVAEEGGVGALYKTRIRQIKEVKAVTLTDQGRPEVCWSKLVFCSAMQRLLQECC